MMGIVIPKSENKDNNLGYRYYYNTSLSLKCKHALLHF